MILSTTSAAVFECRSKACAPPPVGTGGSRGGAGGGRSSSLRSKSLREGRIAGVGKGLSEPDSGFTKSTQLRDIRSGFSVALKGSDVLIDSKDAYLADGSINPKMRSMIKDRLRAALGTKPPKGTKVALGGWHNPEDGKIEVNVSIVFPKGMERQAREFAVANDQIAMARLHPPFEIIATGGTGGERAIAASARPVNKRLYAAVKAEAKRKFDVYPSAYANGWIVQEYKRRGGRYRGKSEFSLKKWFAEDWVDISRPKEGGGFEPCGRPDASEGAYPKCVPASKAARMTQEEIDSAVRRKRTAERTQDRDGKKPIMVSTFGARLKDPKGGLTPAGRKAFGGNLKPGVKNYTSASDADKQRWISWARRFYARDTYPAFVDENGEPTRFALTARAWGEPVPKNAADARRIAAKAAMRQRELDAKKERAK